MNTFHIGDLHLGHQKIIEHSNRPFKDVREMDETIIKNWNSVVGVKDEVYVYGDFALTGRQKTEEYLAALKGKKYLLRGNHDHWVSNPNCRRHFAWIKDYFELKENGRLWVLCHYPLYSWNRRNYGGIHLHAHTHKQIDLNYQTEKEIEHLQSDDAIYNRYFCVSAECLNYTPISSNELITKMKL